MSVTNSALGDDFQRRKEAIQLLRDEKYAWVFEKMVMEIAREHGEKAKNYTEEIFERLENEPIDKLLEAVKNGNLTVFDWIPLFNVQHRRCATIAWNKLAKRNPLRYDACWEVFIGGKSYSETATILTRVEKCIVDSRAVGDRVYRGRPFLNKSYREEMVQTGYHNVKDLYPSAK